MKHLLVKIVFAAIWGKLVTAFVPLLSITTPCCRSKVSVESTNTATLPQIINNGNYNEAQRAVAAAGTNRVRIRTSIESDLKEISTFLGEEVVGTLPNNSNNIYSKHALEILRVSSAFETILKNRLQAFQEGKNLVSELSEITQGEEDDQQKYTNIIDSDQLRRIWARDSFRSKIRFASVKSKEPHVWENHNFALVPEDPSWLQHILITADDIPSKQVIGFCEIAMLRPPTNENDHDTCVSNNCNSGAHISACVPTMLNLITSSQWRRNGVAKRLVKGAERFVQLKWGCEELSMYVDKSNIAAVSLYKSLGYEIVSSNGKGSKWFMTKDLQIEKGLKLELINGYKGKTLQFWRK